MTYLAATSADTALAPLQAAACTYRIALGRRPASAGPSGIRVFAIDMEQCPQCGETLKLIAAIEDPTVMAKILTHLGLSISTPPRATFAVIRPTPNGLIPTDPRFTPVQPLSRHSL